MLTLLRSRRGLAGVEFALVAPMLLIMLFGVVDLCRAILMIQRLTAAAASTATIASTMAVQASSLNTLTGQQAWQATTAPFAVFPKWRLSRQPGTFAITLSSIGFTTGHGGYSAHVTWSAANPSGQTQMRPCGTLAQAPNSAPVTLGTLPAGDYGPTSILLADVSGVFVPMFTSVFVAPLTFMRSASVSPRINNGVTLTGVFPGPSVTCPTAL